MANSGVLAGGRGWVEKKKCKHFVQKRDTRNFRLQKTASSPPSPPLYLGIKEKFLSPNGEWARRQTATTAAKQLGLGDVDDAEKKTDLTHHWLERPKTHEKWSLYRPKTVKKKVKSGQKRLKSRCRPS